MVKVDEYWINTFKHGTGKTKEMLHVEYDVDSKTKPLTPGIVGYTCSHMHNSVLNLGC